MTTQEYILYTILLVKSIGYVNSRVEKCRKIIIYLRIKTEEV